MGASGAITQVNLTEEDVQVIEAALEEQLKHQGHEGQHAAMALILLFSLAAAQVVRIIFYSLIIIFED